MWKQQEEFNFKQTLKEKEDEHLSQIADKYKNAEKQREIAFTKAINEISNLESKLRNKLIEIQKRENGLNLLESDLTRKIEDTIKTSTTKDEELVNLRNQYNALKKENDQLIAGYDNKLKNKDNLIHNLENELYNLKTNIEDSAVSRMRSELESKNDEINTYKTKYNLVNEKLKEYKVNYDKLSKKYDLLRKEYEDYKELKLREKEEELLKMKMDHQKIEMREIEKDNINSIKNQLLNMMNKSK